MGFASDYGEGVAAEAVARINERWAWREHEVRIAPPMSAAAGLQPSTTTSRSTKTPTSGGSTRAAIMATAAGCGPASSM